MASSADDATRLLGELRTGDSTAAERLMPLVYARLRSLAGAYFRGQRADHTLDATALVHEAFLRLVDQTDIEWQDRSHFFAVAAGAMRMILADHSRRKRAAKRGGNWARVTLSMAVAPKGTKTLDLLALDEALTKLATLNERHARIVELRFFSGLSVEEVAHVLDCSRSTIESDWRVVRAWLGRELRDRSAEC